jgi:nitrogen fixation/metabolism regulation signal transduction histidine kinase
VVGGWVDHFGFHGAGAFVFADPSHAALGGLRAKFWAFVCVEHGVFAAMLAGIDRRGLVCACSKRVRQGKFGSRLLVKLATIFALVGILPGLLIYAVSYQFVTRSIEVWFDTKVEVALDAGLNLSRSTLESLSNEFSRQCAQCQPRCGERTRPIAAFVARKNTQISSMPAKSRCGRVNAMALASVSQDRYQLHPDRPSASEWRQVRSQGISWRSEGLDDNLASAASPPRITVLVQISSAGFQLEGQGRVLQVVKQLPPVLVANALAVLDANRQYQERALARLGLKRMYIGTLTLSLFLAVFGAVLLAVLLGNQLARPLLLLAEGVRDVAAGDLSPRAVLQGKDELDGLTRSFAQMTEQLSQARQSVESSMAQVNVARSHLQTMLDNLTCRRGVARHRGSNFVDQPRCHAHIASAIGSAYGQSIDRH